MLSVMLNKYISFQEITTFLVKILFSIQKYLSVIHNPGFLMYTFLVYYTLYFHKHNIRILKSLINCHRYQLAFI